MEDFSFKEIKKNTFFANTYVRVLEIKNLINNDYNNIEKMIKYYCYAEKYKKVIINYERLLRDYPKKIVENKYILPFIIVAYFNLGEYKKVIDFKREILNREKVFDFQIFSLYSILSASFNRIGDSEKAKEIIQPVILSQNTDKEIKYLGFVHLGKMLIENNEFEKVYECILNSLEYISEKNYFSVFSLLTLLFLHEGNNACAIKMNKIRKMLKCKLNKKKALYIANEMEVLYEESKKECFNKISMIFYNQFQ